MTYIEIDIICDIGKSIAYGVEEKNHNWGLLRNEWHLDH